MKKKAIMLGLVLSMGIFVSTTPTDAGISENGMGRNGVSLNGIGRNGITKHGFSSTSGLDFTTISHQGLGK